MAQFAIRCLPRVPVANKDLEHWLEQELGELRRHIPQGIIRLSRLTQPLPSTDVGIGWLIEFDLRDDQSLLEGGRLASLLRDLRLLGFQPTLLARPGTSGWPNPPIGPAPGRKTVNSPSGGGPAVKSRSRPRIRGTDARAAG
jgi:hypothetical protein